MHAPQPPSPHPSFVPFRPSSAHDRNVSCFLRQPDVSAVRTPAEVPLVVQAAAPNSSAGPQQVARADWPAAELSHSCGCIHIASSEKVSPGVPPACDKGMRCAKAPPAAAQCSGVVRQPGWAPTPASAGLAAAASDGEEPGVDLVVPSELDYSLTGNDGPPLKFLSGLSPTSGESASRATIAAELAVALCTQRVAYHGTVGAQICSFAWRHAAMHRHAQQTQVWSHCAM